MRETIEHFLSFLKRPIDQKDLNASLAKKMKTLGILLLVDIPVAGVFVGLISLLEYFELFKPEDHRLTEMMQQNGLIGTLVLGVLVIPLFEELLFRLYLRYKYNPWFRLRESIVKMDTTKEEERVESIQKIRERYTKVYPMLFYFAAVLFGMAHIFNFKQSINYVLLAPILVGPQIAAGLIAGYLRVQFNVWMGYMYHALHNLVFLSIPFLFITYFVETKQFNQGHQHLEISEAYFDNSSSYSSSDSVYIGSMSLKSALAFIQDQEEDMYVISDPKLLNKKVSLTFTVRNSEEALDGKWASEKVLEFFKLKATSTQTIKDIYELTVADSQSLSNYRHAKNDRKLEITLREYSLTCKNISMHEFCRSLSKFSGKKIINETNDYNTYDIELRNRSFREIKRDLQIIYGLNLKLQEIETEEIIINSY